MRHWITFLIPLLVLGTLDTASAQQQRNAKDPHIGYIYPAGGQVGAVMEVTVGGQFLEGVKGVLVSGDNVEASIVKYTKPLSNKEFNELRDKLMEARMKAGEQGMVSIDMLIRKGLIESLAKEIGISDEKIKELIDYRRKLSDPKRQQNPQLSESVRIKITILPGATIGLRELRLDTPSGLSNPLRFYVGNLPEFTRSEEETKSKLTIDALPITINGQLLPGHVDRYAFPARQGMHLVTQANVRGLIPFLADAVPGWFQAGLTLYDDKGREVAHADDFRFDPDPVLLYEFPNDGQYVIEIKDTLYRGREDFVYRLTLSDLPFVTGMFPMGGREGEKTMVSATGWNLPASGLKVEQPVQNRGVYPLAYHPRQGVDGSMRFAVDSLPEILEREPNQTNDTAQPINLPMVINGRIDAPEDRDSYRFDGRSGQKIIAEVMARRLNSPVDSVLRLTDAAGKQIAVNDDYEDKGEGLTTHHADSRLSCTLPTTGVYYLQIADAQQKGGPDYSYRLRISAPRPDFALRVVPSCINVRAGAVVPVTVYALRQDDFAGEITLSVKSGPTGAVLDGARIPAGQDMVRTTLTIPATATLGTSTLAIEGRALIQNDDIRHIAAPADDMMQAFSYRHLVVSSQAQIDVLDAIKFAPPIKLSQTPPVRLRRGEANSVRFTTAMGTNMVNQIFFELSDPPAGLTLENTRKDKNNITLVVRVDGEKIKDPLAGNLLLNAYMERTPPPAQGKPAGMKQRTFLGVMPAIPFEVTP